MASALRRTTPLLLSSQIFLLISHFTTSQPSTPITTCSCDERVTPSNPPPFDSFKPPKRDERAPPFQHPAPPDTFKTVDYPKLNYGSDLYIKNPKVSDLPILYESWQKGNDVWPWIWCHRNANGPHHVFILSSTNQTTQHAKALLCQIESLAKSSPNNNIVVVVEKESGLASAPGSPGLSWFYQNRCGVIEGQVQLFDAKAKILMLDDERIIAFDSCSIASDVDGVQKEEDE